MLKQNTSCVDNHEMHVSPGACGPWLSLAAVLFLATAPAPAQSTANIKLEKVEVGFASVAGASQGSLFKPGLWTPVLVTLSTGSDGKMQLPAQADGTCRGQLLVEGTDGDGGQNIYAAPFVLPARGRTTVLGYTMPGSTAPDLTLSLAAEEQPGRRVRLESGVFQGLGLNQHLYLILGADLKSDMQTTLAAMASNKEAGDTAPRFAAFEDQVARLPELWFGYQAVDLMVLTSDNDNFLADLESSPARMKALAGWVGQGGRLLVSVSWRNQARVSSLLSSRGWMPVLPDLLHPKRQTQLSNLAGLLTWANILTKPFSIPRNKPLPIPVFQPGLDTEVIIREETGEPLLVRVPHGRGSVSLLALDVTTDPFIKWEGRFDFWKALLTWLAPAVQTGVNPDLVGLRGEFGSSDPAAQLHRELDNFDVPVISFGWVALLILLYIVVVGPLDYLILKKVFKRLEWTWITFPLVVALVSVLAYYTVYALKGRELRVNQVDLVDIDLRSAVDEAGRTRQADSHVFGTTWFAVLSPQVDTYTLGIEPTLTSWTGVAEQKRPEVMLTWMGRPEAAQGGFGRQRAPTLFSRSYDYAPNASGLRNVRIPIWTTRAFSAAWDMPLALPPFKADLFYRRNDPDQRVQGTIRSRLPANLQDVYLFYGTKAYPLQGGLPGGKEARVIPVQMDAARAVDAGAWARTAGQPIPFGDDLNVSRSRRSFNPTPIINGLFFQEYAGGNNHSFRPLDQSWRLREYQARDKGVRDLILIGRLPRAQGLVKELTAAADSPLPTRLWLSDRANDLPGPGQQRPNLSGTLTQHTYVRVFLPVRPQ
jgi:hypothetical protein